MYGDATGVGYGGSGWRAPESWCVVQISGDVICTREVLMTTPSVQSFRSIHLTSSGT